MRARACYVCKQRYHEVDAFHHQLCPACAARNRARREARTDLRGRRALLTGGRAKIGMYIALRLLRDGADTTITTRFPRDAARRFAGMPDSADWLHRLRIVGIDLRNPGQVLALADAVAARGPLDILINNAAQTVRRSAGGLRPARARRGGRAPARARCPSWSPLAPGDRAAPAAEAPARGALGADAPRRERARPDGRIGLARADRRRPRDRRRRPGPGSRPRQQLEPPGGGGRRPRAARGAAVQHDRALHPGEPPAGVARRLAGAAHLHRQRLGHGGAVRPRLQGARAPAHQHGEGRPQHAHAHQRRRRCSRATGSS